MSIKKVGVVGAGTMGQGIAEMLGLEKAGRSFNRDFGRKIDIWQAND